MSFRTGSSRNGRSRSGSGRMIWRSLVENDALIIVVSYVLSFGCIKETCQVFVMVLLVFSTDSDVVKIREHRFEILFLHKFHNFPLEAGYSICHTKGQSCELVKAISSFKSCLRFVFVSKRYLIIGTFKFDGAEESIVRNFVDGIIDSG